MRLCLPLLLAAVSGCAGATQEREAAVAPETTAALTQAPELRGEWVQGGVLVGRVAPGSEVRFGQRALRVSPQGEFVLGLGRDAGPSAELEVRYPGGAQHRYTFPVRQREYPVQRIDGLPPTMVTPPPAALRQIELDNKRVAAARAMDSALAAFAGELRWPVTGPVTGVYGSQRILNGEARQPHYGVDIAASKGTPVRTMAAGVARLARDDLYFTGGTIIVDHGHGLSSTYLHLSKLLVKEGEEIQAGQVIGEVGATGRVTGPHLCFRVNWFETRLDPQLVLGAMPASSDK